MKNKTATLLAGFFITTGTALGISGNIVGSFQIPLGGVEARFCQGGTYDGTYLYVLDDYDWTQSFARIIKLTTAGSIVGTPSQAPRYYTGANWRFQKGLTWDGTYFWMTEAKANEGVCYKFSPGSTTIISSFLTPNKRPRDCAWYGGYIWEVDGVSGYVYKLTTGGSVAASFQVNKTENERYFGLAHDGRYLWIGKYGKNDGVECYTPAGSRQGFVAIPEGSGTFKYRHPMGFASDAQDYVWIVDGNTDYLIRVHMSY
jgi:hypothetical protein